MKRHSPIAASTTPPAPPRHCEPKAWQSTPNAMPSHCETPSLRTPQGCGNPQSNGCSLYPIPQTLYPKKGISLIAVLMFMLAATIASTVLFRYLGTENFASGSRLKHSEAFMASESGLDAVQGWLSNRAGDVGALVFQYQKDKKPILMTKDEPPNYVNVLGTIGGQRSQQYRVWLIGADASDKNKPIKLKFLSVGEARDGSKATQTAIFSVDGLYRITIPSQVQPPQQSNFNQAFFGGFSSNTQGKFSSAIINGDMNINGFTSHGNLLVTGNLTTSDNGDRKIGCPADGSDDPPGDLYVTGDVDIRGFIICGNAYIGGQLRTSTGPVFQKDLYAAGGISTSSSLTVWGNTTLGADWVTKVNDQATLLGNLVMDDIGKGDFLQPQSGNIVFTNDNFSNNTNLSVSGSVWAASPLSGTKPQNKANHIKFGTDNSKNPSVCIPQVQTANTPYKSGNVNFTSPNTVPIAPPCEKPIGATNLSYLAEKIDPETGRVPDPLVVPDDTKNQWLEKANTLDQMANPATPADTSVLKNISNACLRLLKKNNSRKEDDIQGKWLGCDNGSQNQFENYVNQCYADLKNYDNGSLLYGDDPNSKQFLAVNLVGNCNGDPHGILENNIIFIFKDIVTADIKLGETSSDANIFFYLAQKPIAMSGKFAFTGSRSDGKSRNYFIYSEGDIGGASGSTTISGTIFLANGSKSGAITDTDINFNQDLFNSLVNAGIIASTDPNENTGGGGESQVESGTEIFPGATDSIYIPVASRLLVNIESKEISTEKEPLINTFTNLAKRIVPMPRTVRIKRNDFAGGKTLRDHYTYTYLNGAKHSDTTAFSTANPQCVSAEGNTLGNTSPHNEDGFYVCRFTGSPAVPHSIFFVQVADSSGMPKVSLSPPVSTIEGTEAQNNGTVGNGCRQITLNVDQPNDNEGWIVPVTVQEGTGENWDVTINNSNCTGDKTSGYVCTIPEKQYNADILITCPNYAGTPSRGILFKLGATCTNGCTVDLTADTAKVLRETPKTPVTRNSDWTEESDWKQCPTSFISSSEWVSISCDGFVAGDVNENWLCDVGSAASRDFADVNNYKGCEVKSDNRESFTVQSVEESDNTTNSFTADLKWKTATLTINNNHSTSDNTLYLQTANQDVPEAERTLTCNGSCTIWQGVAYQIKTSNDPYKWACSGDDIVCANESPADGLSNILTNEYNSNYTLKAYSDIAVTLDRPAPPSLSCQLNTASIKQGASISASDFTVIHGGYGCDPESPTVTFTDNDENSFTASRTYSTAGNYTFSASSTSCGGVTATCTGQLTVSAIAAPSLSCNWADTPPFIKNTSHDLKAALSGEAGTTCKLSISRNGFSGGTDIENATLGEKTFTFTARNAASAADNVTITASECVNNGVSLIASPAACTKTADILNEAPCEYQESFCDKAFSEVEFTEPNVKEAANRCFFLTSITNMYKVYKINGVDISGGDNNGCSIGGNNLNCDKGSFDNVLSNYPAIQKKDGGYYVWVKQFSSRSQDGNWNNNFTFGSRASQCVVPSLICNWDGKGRTMYTGEAAPSPAPQLSCSDGELRGLDSWNDTPAAGDALTYGIYTPTPQGTLTCGGKTPKPFDNDCGTLTVKYAPTALTCGAVGSDTQLPAIPTAPTLSITDQSNLCSAEGSNTPNLNPITWTFTRENSTDNGAGKTAASWNSIFTTAGTYSSFQVSGKCGDYSTALSANCDGSIAVSASALPACDYKPEWCNGIAFEDIQWNTHPTPQSGKCYFASCVSNTCYLNYGYDVQWKINGADKTGNMYSDPGVEKKDGGYYIYMKTTGGSGDHGHAEVLGSKRTDCTPSGGGTPASSSSAATSSSSSSSSSESGGGGTGTPITVGNGGTVIPTIPGTYAITCSKPDGWTPKMTCKYTSNPGTSCTLSDYNISVTADENAKTIKLDNCWSNGNGENFFDCDGTTHTVEFSGNKGSLTLKCGYSF